MLKLLSDEAKIKELMLQYLGSNPNYTPYGKPCTNTGYRKLSSNGEKFTIKPGDAQRCYSYYSYISFGYVEYCYGGYGNYESCLWAIHAPGAQAIRVTLKKLEVSTDFRLHIPWYCIKRYLL